jgi:manganese-dependent inorganic pyrophosphatase
VIISNGVEPPEDVLELARERGTAVVRSPLDSYVSGRMITLSAPCSTMMDREPLTVRPDDLLEDVEGEISDIHYQAAVAVDGSRPIGLITRASLLHPQPRRVILVDHAEQAQSVHGVETAEIVEILDHHHVGSIETRVPVLATFDPVGSTATLVIERFRQNGMEPARPTAIMLLGAVLSDTVILNSPTTTTRDHEAVAYFGRALGIDPIAFGREMFEETADLSDVPADQIVTRDAKEYESSGSGTICIAQVETVGRSVLDRREELQEAMDAVRERRDYACLAVMVTDIMEKHTALLVSGQRQAVEKALGRANGDGIIDLPGVMSRKKQLAPKLLAAF